MHIIERFFVLAGSLRGVYRVTGYDLWRLWKTAERSVYMLSDGYVDVKTEKMPQGPVVIGITGMCHVYVYCIGIKTTMNICCT